MDNLDTGLIFTVSIINLGLNKVLFNLNKLFYLFLFMLCFFQGCFIYKSCKNRFMYHNKFKQNAYLISFWKRLKYYQLIKIQIIRLLNKVGGPKFKIIYVLFFKQIVIPKVKSRYIWFAKLYQAWIANLSKIWCFILSKSLISTQWKIAGPITCVGVISTQWIL